MIARRDVGEFQIATDVLAVMSEELEQRREPLFIEQRRMTKKLEGDEQIHRAQRHFHRTGPVGPKAGRILLMPAHHLREKFCGEVFAVSKRVSTTERDQVAEAI